MAKKATAATATADADDIITVRARVLGYAGDRRRRPGDVFRVRARSVSGAQGQLASWLERVPDGTPERTMTPSDYARQEQARLGARVPTINPVGHTIEYDDEPAAAGRDVI